jgi:hypothetical protein
MSNSKLRTYHSKLTMSLIFMFLDGVGLAPAGPDNPLTDADTPTLRALLGGPLTIERTKTKGLGVGDWGLGIGTTHLTPNPQPPTTILFKAIDATLGIPGLPQSGTGQTALLVGVNAAELHGRHQPHFPPVALRPLLAERNVLRRVVECGGRATFANPFGPGYWAAVAARRIRRSASVIASEGAGLRFRDIDDLRAGRAVAWDVTGAALREREPAEGLPLVTPGAAGAQLARLADDHDLVFYESFLPDLAGHGRLTTDDRPPTADDLFDTAQGRRRLTIGIHGDTETTDNGQRTTDDGQNTQYAVHDTQHSDDRSTREQIDLAMSRLDGLIGGVLDALRPQDTLLVTSDHGNIESRAAPAHTRNPVPLLVVGPAAAAFADVASIMDVAGAILSSLGC